MHDYEFMVALWLRLYLIIWPAAALKIVDLHAIIGSIVLLLSHLGTVKLSVVGKIFARIHQPKT